jgi:hypothetical protein
MSMRMLRIIGVITATCLSSIALAQDTDAEPTTPAPVSLEDLDYQIKLCKQYIEEYKNQAFLFDEKAQSLLSHDFMGYRNAESMSQQSQSIANDLTTHLQNLEKQRAEMMQRQSQTQPQSEKK